MLSFPVRAEDALFLHAQTVSCPQQVGAVVLLDGPGVDLTGLRASVAARVGQLPQLRRRLIPARGRWARPRWVIDPSVDVSSRITEIISADGSLTSMEEVVGRYFAEPVDPAEAAWQLLLVRAASAGPSAIVVKAHHALGDSYALIAELSGLFDGQAPRPRTARLGSPKPGGSVEPVGDGSRRRARASTALRIARGLAGLSLVGRPGLIGVDDGASPATSQRREFAAISLDARMVAVKARTLGAGTVDLVLGVAASALGQLMAGRGQPAAAATVRAMVPCSLRSAGSSGRPTARRAEWAAASGGAGNRTAGVLLDLPVGPMSLTERVTAVRAVRQARLRRGDAEASAFVLRVMNLLPAPVQRIIARSAFTSRRFSLIVSVFPGTRQSRRLLGAPPKRPRSPSWPAASTPWPTAHRTSRGSWPTTRMPGRPGLRSRPVTRTTLRSAEGFSIGPNGP